MGIVLAGVFVTDAGYGYPPGAPAGMPTTASVHGAIHDLVSVFVFGGLAAAMLAMARRFAGDGSR